MQEFFKKITSETHLETEGLQLYQRQLQSRLITMPADIFFPRLQSLWGRNLVLEMLAAFYRLYPPASVRWEETLRELPAFLATCSLTGLADMAAFSLQTWSCLHGRDPLGKREKSASGLDQLFLEPACCFYLPVEAIDLFQYWQLNPRDGMRQGCIFLKTSFADASVLPLPEVMLPLLQRLGQGYSLEAALELLCETEAQALAPLLPQSISLWHQTGLLIPCLDP